MRVKNLGLAILGSASLAITLPAGAATTWTFSGSNNGCQTYAGSPIPAGCLNQRTVNSGGTTLTATGWGITSNGDTEFAQGYLSIWGGGLGVTNADRNNGDSGEGGDPEHAVDNNDRFDFVLMTFDKAVKLTSVELGWAPGDSDMTIVRYANAGVPTLASLDGQTYSDLTGAGWDAAVSYNFSGTGTKNVDTGEYSQAWLIGAYAGWGANVNADKGDDKFKIAAVTGDPRQVPEPASALLFAAALVGMWGARRTKLG